MCLYSDSLEKTSDLKGWELILCMQEASSQSLTLHGPLKTVWDDPRVLLGVDSELCLL